MLVDGTLTMLYRDAGTGVAIRDSDQTVPFQWGRHVT